MATPSPTGDYITLEDAKVWFDPKKPDAIHLTINDPDIGPDGWRMRITSNVRSADYNPVNFNKLRMLLINLGKSAPDQAAETGPRRLDKRGFRWMGGK